MRRLVLGATMVAMVIGFNGCAGSNNMDSSKLDKSFEEYKTYNSHKAMAVAMGDDGRYAMGYSYDYSSQNKANERAIKQCNDANDQSSANKVTAKCELYAIDNDLVRDSD
jgi:hypothetical protein